MATLSAQGGNFREPSPTRALKPMYLLNTLITSQIASNKLLLADSGLADEGCKLFKDIQALPGLQGLDLRGNRITSVGLQEVVRFLRKCINVENLSLNWNDLENDNLVGMEELERFMNDGGVCHVKFLDLRNSNLSLNSKDLLARIIRCPTLRYLDLSWNNFNDSMVPDILRALSERQAAIQLELKGTGLSNPSLNTISEAIRLLGVRFPTAFEQKFTSEDILKDVDGKKRLALDNLYNIERLNKMKADGGRIILNPDTAELEILMGEMLKKKMLGKDKLLRELDEKIKNLHDIDLEMQELAVLRDQAANENLNLRRELDNIKTAYGKMKQSNQIEQESLATQVRSLQSAINKRDIEHRSMVDRLLAEQRSRLKNYSDQLENKDLHLVEKIKSLSMDKDRLDKDLTAIKQRMITFMQNFNAEIRAKQEQAKLEERARADWTQALLESRTLSVNEGADMAQRRGNEDLKLLQESEAVLMAKVMEMQQELTQKRQVLSSLDMAVKTVKTNNDRLLDEDRFADGSISKLKDQLQDLMENIRRKKELIDTNMQDAEIAVDKEQAEIEYQRVGQEDKMAQLEGALRKIRLEIERLDMKREYCLDTACRKVSGVIYDTLLNRTLRNT